jgi:hypothetical protein
MSLSLLHPMASAGAGTECHFHCCTPWHLVLGHLVPYQNSSTSTIAFNGIFTRFYYIPVDIYLIP